MPQVQFVRGAPSKGAQIANILGESLGEGIGSAMGDFFANRALEGVLDDPELKDKPLSERFGAMERALAKHGERGQRLLTRRLGVEQQAEQERVAEQQRLAEEQQRLAEEEEAARIETARAKFGLPEYFKDLPKAEQQAFLKERAETQKIERKEAEDQAGRDAALGVVARMRDIRANGNLGIGSGALALGNPAARRERGEYQQLGKSLISFATNIPIRNRIEFETLAEQLFDPNLTDATAEGLLDAMERIITRGEQVGQAATPTIPPSKQPRQSLEEIFG